MLRATQAHRLLLSKSESLDWGIAYTSEEFPDLTRANQFREVIIEAGVDFEQVFQAVEAYYAERNLTFHGWAPAMDQDVDPHEAFLTGKGFVRRDEHAMLVREWMDVAIPDDVRVLPARAMRKALDAVLDERLADSSASKQMHDAVVGRLDDASMNGFVAQKAGEAAGYLMFFEVGDIGCVTDIYVRESLRRQGVGTALLDHAMKLSRRLALRIQGARVPKDDAAAVALFEKLGMEPDGTLTEFVRSGS